MLIALVFRVFWRHMAIMTSYPFTDRQSVIHNCSFCVLYADCISCVDETREMIKSLSDVKPFDLWPPGLLDLVTTYLPLCNPSSS